MDCPSHYLDGRKIDPKRAQALRKDGKMFVGGIKPETDNETVKEYFSKFGEVRILAPNNLLFQVEAEFVYLFEA